MFVNNFITLAVMAVITEWVIADTPLNEIVLQLFQTIQAQQESKDAPYSPPFSWGSQRGMYKNEVRLNFHGPIDLALIRDKFQVPDSNAFTVSWVTSALLEAYKYGKAPKPSDEHISMGLDVIDKYRNKNVPYDNSEMTFWPQIFNKTTNFYESSPDNLFGVMRLPDYLPQKAIEELLKLLHLQGLEKIFEEVLQERFDFAAAFHIPPDFDDTFVNIGLGFLLATDGRFPAAAAKWQQRNKNITSAFNALKKYAYRPFSSDQRVNTIDGRTYFYLHDFIEKASSTGSDLALVSTWLQDTDEVRIQQPKGVSMPFNINNVDVTVSANVIYGITMVAITNVTSDPATLIDTDVEQIYLNTTSLIAHEIANNFTSRPDLALTYYPSKYEFYWFVSRTYAYLNRFYVRNLPTTVNPRLDVMVRRAFNILMPVLLSDMTKDILKSAKVDSDGLMYLDDFLGNNDFDLFNRSKNRAEDRIFTTSMSLAALLNTWTLWDGDQLIWEKKHGSLSSNLIGQSGYLDGMRLLGDSGNTPGEVKQLLSKGVQWLTKNTLSGKYKAWNTFFSGSGKGRDSMPFEFPANRLEFFNGTKFNDTKYPHGFDHIIGFQGHVTSDVYAAMLKQPRFGKMTKVTFDGYNSDPNGYFPFWSSEPYTYSVTLLVLSQFQNIKPEISTFADDIVE